MTRISRDVRREMHGKQGTNQPPRHVAALTLCDTSLSTAAGPALSRSSCCPRQRLPFFRWQRVPLRTGPSWWRKYSQALVFWSKSGCGTWMCRHLRGCLVDVQCANICCLMTVVFFIQKAQNKHDFLYCGPPFAVLRFVQNSTLLHIKMPRHRENTVPNKQKAQS